MCHRLLFWALVVLAYGQSGCHESETIRLSYLTSADTILAFGDSLTFGTGASDGSSYPSQLEKLIGRTVVRSAVPGELSAAALTRLPREIARHRPSLVLLCHGGNDILQRRDPQQIYNNLAKMIELLKAQEIEVLLIGVPALSLQLSTPTAAPFYGQLAADMKVPFDGTTLPGLLFDSRFKSDAIHLNENGYKKLAEELAALLKKAKAI